MLIEALRRFEVNCTADKNALVNDALPPGDCNTRKDELGLTNTAVGFVEADVDRDKLVEALLVGNITILLDNGEDELAQLLDTTEATTESGNPTRLDR